MSLIVWKALKDLSVVFYSWSFWITLKTCNYPLCHYDITLNNFRTSNKQLKYLGRWGNFFNCLIFFQVKPNYKEESKNPKMRLLYHEHKWPICVTRRGYPETRNCPNSSFSNNFCHFNLNNEETFLFFFKPKTWVTKKCYVLIRTIKENFAMVSHYLNLFLKW